MFARFVLSFLFVLLAACSNSKTDPPPAAPIQNADVARFVPGDLFEVRVFNEEDLGGDFQVQDDGSIDFPLVGRINVEGMTQAEVAKAIEAKLADGYLKSPQVTVVVTERQNLDVTVIGQVSKPGTFPYVDQLTLVQAISDAGGLTPLAASKKIKLIRQGPKGRETFEISLKAITEGRAEDPKLQPGDTVVVPETVF